jgi:ABC-type nitrate/sulfonate/bicarbonate transport system permease component
MRLNALKLKGSNVEIKISSYVRRALGMKTLAGIFSLVAFVALWQAVVALSLPYLSNLPYPGQVWKSLVEMAGTAGYWISWAASLKRIFISFILAQALGIPLGLFMGMSRLSLPRERHRHWSGG